MRKSLGDYIVDRTESLNDELVKEYFIDRMDNKISRLLDSEQYLLEGSRGIGKTMLMRQAELESDNNFGKSSILTVWISFEESLRIDRIKIVDNSTDPFLQWTMGKILNEVLKKIIKLKPKYLDKLNSRLSNIFGDKSDFDYSYYSKILNEYIEVLEKAEINDNRDLTDKVPSKKLLDILDNPTSFRSFLLKLIDDFELKRLVLLFDEAAHVFSLNQQEKFFTFFKTLRNPKIACKASVYPGITNYGKTFERNQDAKELKINWSMREKEDIKYIKRILKKRIQNYNLDYWNLLTRDSEIIDTICVCSNGNPRFAFHIIDELQNKNLFQRKNISNRDLLNCIRTVVSTKWKEFETLSRRLVKYKDYIIKAENFLKGIVIPNLRKWNKRKRADNRKLSAGFYIQTSAYEEISKLFDILAYSNFINVNYSKKSLGHDKYGYYISLNPSLMFSNLIIRNINEIQDISISIENNQAYYETTKEINNLINKLKVQEEYHCSNNKCDFVTNDNTFTFCKKCGSKMEITESESLYKILRSHPIENLSLSNKIVSRLKKKFITVGEIYDADLDDIRMKYIQDVRIRKVKNAAIEYMAG